MLVPDQMRFIDMTGYGGPEVISFLIVAIRPSIQMPRTEFLRQIKLSRQPAMSWLNQ